MRERNVDPTVVVVQRGFICVSFVCRAKLAVGSAGLIHSDAQLVAGCLSPNCGDQSSAERPVETGSAGFVSAADDDDDWKSRTLGNYMLLATDIESADWSQPIRCVDRATGEQKLCKVSSFDNTTTYVQRIHRWITS